MDYPNGKTPAQLTRNIHQSDLKEFDLGYKNIGKHYGQKETNL